MRRSNLMEDKQLNFNQPLLSVRRNASAVVAEKDDKKGTKSSLGHLPRPPSYKSELKSGPVRNPGVVPFVWEQSPGKPKDEGMLQIDKIDRPSNAPKLPPGRTLKANKQYSDNHPSNPTINRNEIGKPDVYQRVPSVDQMSHGVECFEDLVEEENSDSREGSEIYVDALDTLSRTESFFLNCSVSGVSGLVEQDVKPSGIFSADPETRDFMIDRFLPAAKAMVSEIQTPQYVPKKPPVIQDQPRQLKKVVNADKKPQLRYGPSFVQHYTQSQYTEEEESDDDYDEISNLQTKVCGLLPRFCLRSSFCLLNPVPGMSVRTRVPTSPASRVHDTRSSSASSCSKTENERFNLDVSEQRSTDGSQTNEQHEENNGSSHKPKKIYSDSQKIEGTYPHRQFQSSGMSHYQKMSSLSHEQKSVLTNSTEDANSIVGGIGSQENNYTSFKELLANQSTSEESGFPAGEKTLYIDNVHREEHSDKKSGLAERKELTGGRNKENRILNTGIENFWRGLESVEKSSLVNAVKKPNNFQKPRDFNSHSSLVEPTGDSAKELSKALVQDEKLYREATNLASVEVSSKESTESFQKQTQKPAKMDNSQGMYLEFPTPPPLPKSPSDSWLCRTLPSMSSKIAYLHSHIGIGTQPRNHQTFKTQSTDAKWEMIVKTTKVHQQHHFRYAEELLPPISET